MVLFGRVANRIVSEVPKYQKVFSAVSQTESRGVRSMKYVCSRGISCVVQDNEVILDKLKSDRTVFTGVTALVGFALVNALYGLSLM